jgi:hypothetical protein
MAENSPVINDPVGAGGRNNQIDTFTVQFLLNTARARMNLKPIGLDGDVGPETIGAISEFQRQSFGRSDGKIDPGFRTFQRLVEIHSEPELVSPKEYSTGKNKRYTVTVGIDGRIFVKPGDWTSKYSAAINGDYIHIHDFGHMVNGKLHLLSDPNLIRAGEVIYHLPTYKKFMEDKLGIEIPNPPTISDQEKKKMTEDFVKQDFKLKGDNGIRVVDFIGDQLQWMGPVAEVLSYAAPFLEALAESFAIITIPFEMYGMVRDFSNVSDTDVRMYGMRAAAYASTAWAFNKSIPTSSPSIRRNHQQQPKSPEQMARLDKFWTESANAAVAAQQKYATDNFGGPGVTIPQRLEAYKAALRGIGDGKPGKLSAELMKQLGTPALKNSTPGAKRVWESLLQVVYPD